MNSSHAPLATIPSDLKDSEPESRRLIAVDMRGEEKPWEHPIQTLRTEVRNEVKGRVNFIHSCVYGYGSERRKAVKYEKPTYPNKFEIHGIRYILTVEGWFCFLNPEQKTPYKVIVGKEVLDMYSSGELFK